MIKMNDANNFRRIVAGLSLIAGPLLVFAGALATPWEVSGAKADYLQSLAESPVQAQIAADLLYFGFLLIAVGIFGMIHLIRRRAVVLGHVAGVLAVWGWVTVPGLLVTDFYDLSLAQSANRQEAVIISDRAENYAGAAVLGIPVLVGFVGPVLLLMALWRARFAPVWVPPAVFAGMVTFSFAGDTGDVSSSIVVAGIATGLMLAGLGYVGLKILRLSDKEWERGRAPVSEERAPSAEAGTPAV